MFWGISIILFCSNMIKTKKDILFIWSSYRKIQNTKEFIAAEGKRTNDTLLAFQSKFDNELKNNKNYF